MLRSSATSYYNADGLGSVTSLTNSSGALAQTLHLRFVRKRHGLQRLIDESVPIHGTRIGLRNRPLLLPRQILRSTNRQIFESRPVGSGPKSLRIRQRTISTNFVDPLGLYTIAPPKPGHPVTPPPSPALDKLLKCIEDILHISLTVTSTTEGVHQDPGHAAGTSVDLRPPPGISPNAVFCAAGQCGAKWGINEDTSHGGQTTPKTTAANYHLQLFPPHHPSPKAPNAIPPGCVPSPSPGPSPGPNPGASCSNSK